MIHNEYNELYDSIYCGHDVKIAIFDKMYFFEWQNSCIDIYLIESSSYKKIHSIVGNDRNKIIENLFSAKLFESNSINESYQNAIIVDIE